MKKKIIISYDYELFFGIKSGTVQNSIIIPTDKILNCMEKYALKGNFFIDYLMIKCISEQDDPICKNDYKALKKQIQDIISRGHRIELHLHPHWINAKYLGKGLWDYTDFSHYSLSSLNNNEIIHLFEEGANYLNQIAQEIDPQYKICAFRAGGWAIQPFEKLKKAFLQAGIVIDSSTSPGLYNQEEHSSFDFRKMPNKTIYKFEDDVCKEDNKGTFIEVPISSFRKNIIIVIIDKLYRIFTNHFERQTDGSHFRNTSKRKQNNLLKTIIGKQTMMSFSNLSPKALWYASHCNNTQELYCFIDHPKDFNKMTLKGIQFAGKHFESVLYNNLLK